MISLQECKIKLIRACDFLSSKQDELSAVDSIFGDGDHGVTIAKISGIIKRKCEAWNGEAPLGPLLDDIGVSILSTDGGSACPLWGSFFIGMAEGAPKEPALGAAAFAAMMKSGAGGLVGLSTAKVGDKTLMDVVLPLAEKAPGFSEETFFSEAASVAKEGAEYTRQCIAKFGRAKNYKERSIGHPDPGALSLAYFFEGLSL